VATGQSALPWLLRSGAIGEEHTVAPRRSDFTSRLPLAVRFDPVLSYWPLQLYVVQPRAPLKAVAHQYHPSQALRQMLTKLGMSYCKAPYNTKTRRCDCFKRSTRGYLDIARCVVAPFVTRVPKLQSFPHCETLNPATTAWATMRRVQSISRNMLSASSSPPRSVPFPTAYVDSTLSWIDIPTAWSRTS
jgi:hypothetical protein